MKYLPTFTLAFVRGAASAAAALIVLGLLATCSDARAAETKYALVAIVLKFDKDNPSPGEVTIADLPTLAKCFELKTMYGKLPQDRVDFACFRQSGLYFRAD